MKEGPQKRRAIIEIFSFRNPDLILRIWASIRAQEYGRKCQDGINLEEATNFKGMTLVGTVLFSGNKKIDPKHVKIDNFLTPHKKPKILI